MKIIIGRQGADSLKGKRISQREYIKLLEEHYNFTAKFRKVYLEPELEPIETSIEAYREKITVKYPKAATLMILVYSLASALAMSTVIIWTINEVLNYKVDFSPRNVLAISAVFLISKIRLRFFDN